MLQSTQSTEFQTAAGGLRHRLYLPPSHQEKPQPAVVMVHGRAGNDQSMWVFSRALRNIRPVIAAPQAPLPDSIGGFSWWKVEDRKREDERSAETPPAPPNLEPIRVLEKFIRALPQLYNVDSERIYAAGFSQGGGVLSALSLYQPSLLKGIAMLSSFIPKSVAAEFAGKTVAGLPRYFIFHGTKDEVLPPERAEISRDFLARQNAEVEVHFDDVGHKVSSRGIAELQQWFERLMAA